MNLNSFFESPFVDAAFALIVNFSILSCVLLGACWIILRWVQQPVERVRLIQTTVFAVILTGLLGLSPWTPFYKLACLPQSATATSPDGLESVHNAGRFPSTSSEMSSNFEVNSANRISNPSSVSEPSNSLSDPSEQYPNESNVLNNSQITGQHQNHVEGNTASKTEHASLPNFLIVLLVVTFVSGTLFQLTHYILGLFVTGRMLRDTSALPPEEFSRYADHLQKFSRDNNVLVRVSNQLTIPIVAGFFKPTIVLPISIFHGADVVNKLNFALAHEWKHVERRDLMFWQVLGVCQILLGCQPFFWLIRRELRLSQDLIADAHAAETCQDRAAYATTLVEFANGSVAKRENLFLNGTLAMAANRSTLFRRVDMLLNQPVQILSQSRRGVVFAFAGLMVVMALSVASIRLTHAATFDEIRGGDFTEPQNQKDEETSETKDTNQPATHSGKVTDLKSGKPIANAIVTVTRMNSRTWEEIDKSESTTNERGEYSFEIPTEQLEQKGLYLLFDLHHETYAPRHCGSYSYSMIEKNLKLGDAPWFSDLKMVEGAKVHGRVVDESGNPIPNTIIQTESRAPIPTSEFANSSYSETKSDEEGNFSAIVTAEGEASISFLPHEHSMQMMNIGNDRGDLGDIELPEGTSVKGRVLDAVGEPIEGLWVNIADADMNSHYSMQRSAKTSADGSFETRPLKPGKYTVTAATKAEGLIEKLPYGNFFNDNPPAVFIRQTLEIKEDSQPDSVVVQAVPHIYISGQCYNSDGEKSRCHYPMILGRLDGQPYMAHAKQKGDVGQFEMMIPHGLENCRLNFSTSEHIALAVQLKPDQELSTITSYEYDKIEADMTDIKVVRYVAPILQVKLMDSDGKPIETGQVGLVYDGEPAPDPLLVGIKTHTYFEKQTNNVFRSSSLNPNFKFKLFAKSKGYKCVPIEMTMTEGEEKQVELKMTPSTDSETDDSVPMTSDLGADG